MEEAFTSEHWIVRIYKVKQRTPLEPTNRAKKSTKKLYKKLSQKTEETAVETEMVDDAKYVGCFTSESYFGDKVYEGGPTGANYNLALHHAKTHGKKYFAISKSGGDGHAFAFNKLLGPSSASRGNTKGGGCERPCDDHPDKFCGCADMACTSPIPKGEEHNRRWIVYEVK